METKKFCLTERQMPTQWYNIVADMPNNPLPPLHPATKQPVPNSFSAYLLSCWKKSLQT